MTENVKPVHILDLELTNYCNADCVFCPRDSLGRQTGLMSRETLDAIIENIDGFDFRSINLSGFGEPLLNKKIWEFVRLIKSSNDSPLVLVTNGALMHEDAARFIFDTCIDEVRVSYNGSSEEIYNAMMKRLDYHATTANVLGLIRTKGARQKPVVSINTVATDYNTRDLNNLINFWTEHGADKIVVHQCHNRGGYLPDMNIREDIIREVVQGERADIKPQIQQFPTEINCKLYNEQIFVAWNGKVLLCCNDLEGGYVLADITSQNIKEILHIKGQYKDLPAMPALCQDCQYHPIQTKR